LREDLSPLSTEPAFCLASLSCFDGAGCVALTGSEAGKLSFIQIGAPSAIKVAAVRHGVTEITLSDGRLVRAKLHVKDVKPSAQKPGSLNISYNVVTEVMAIPCAPILDVHETVQ
jgi:hypothetical protein